MLGRKLHAADRRLPAAASPRPPSRRLRPSCRCRRILNRERQRRALRAVELDEVKVLLFDQVRRLHDLAAQADEDVRPDVRDAGRSRPACGRVACGPAHRTASPHPCRWTMATMPSTFGNFSEHAGCADAVGDVLARACGAVHGADDREVVASAVAKVVRLARRRGRKPMKVRYSAGGGSGRGHFCCVCIVALEDAELDVVNVDVLARRDRRGSRNR